MDTDWASKMADQAGDAESWKTNIYGVVAELMSQQVRSFLRYDVAHATRDGKDIKLPIPFFDHSFTSNLEWYAQILVSLGILVPVTNKPGECCFVFNVEPKQFYEHACAHAASGPPFDDLLAAFLYHSIDFGGGFRCYQTQLFPVCKEYDHLFRLLAFDGYVTKRGLEYMWTEKAANALTKAHLWPMDDATDQHERRTGRK